jgi:hypothetical protein
MVDKLLKKLKEIDEKILDGLIKEKNINLKPKDFYELER